MSNPARYTLSDAIELAREAPYTFFIPSENARLSVRVGDLVKLVFTWEPPTEKYSTERMWVRIVRIGNGNLEGLLENTPYEKDRMAVGDPVQFQHDNIVDIDWAPPGPSVCDPPYREYWERCMVDDCVLDGSVPVEYLYREKPDLGQDDDTYPDSGWRIRGRRGTATDEDMEARKPQYVALGAVLNSDDSWLHLIDSEIGAAFMRDFETGQYRSVK